MSDGDNRFYRETGNETAGNHSALRIDDDYQHIYWLDPVEGCWVAYRRADCVGEEELPQRTLAAPAPVDEAKLAEVIWEEQESRVLEGFVIHTPDTARSTARAVREYLEPR